MTLDTSLLNSRCSHRYSGPLYAVRVPQNTFIRTYTRYSSHYARLIHFLSCT